MGKVRKFQCANCNRIIENGFEESTVICGNCKSPCTMPDDFGPGVVIDDYLILKLLGEGGMGNVYLAHEFSLDRQVALKILKDSYMSNVEHKIEFINEARSVASLNDPNIIQAYKVGEEDGIVFFVSEFVEGKTLKKILEESGPMDVKDLLPIAIDVVSALGYAWNTRKLVHRDIKPENIMVNTKGVSKLMDLGLSLREGSDVDEGDQIKGTPQYISPDQILGTELDNRTDFYCLGVTLYQLISGKLPFEGNLQTIVNSHLEKEAKPLKKLVPGINDTFARIVHKLMAKIPDQRYQSSDALLSSLKKLQKALEDEEQGKKHFKLTSKFETKLSSPPTEHFQVKKKNTLKLGVLAMLGVLAFVFTLLVALKGKPDNQRLVTKDSKVNEKKTVKTGTQVLEPLALEKEVDSGSKKAAKTSSEKRSKKTAQPAGSATIALSAAPEKLLSNDAEGKLVLKAVADAHIIKPDKNYGSSDSLRLNNHSRNNGKNDAYIRFDLSEVTEPISSATLRLYILGKGRNAQVLGIKVVNDNSWSELSINKDNAPEPGEEIGSGELVPKGYLNVDLSTLALKKMSADKQLSLYIYIKENLGSDTFLNIPSRENSEADKHPVLLLGK